jgi:hypothetical protein
MGALAGLCGANQRLKPQRYIGLMLTPMLSGVQARQLRIVRQRSPWWLPQAGYISF